MRVEARLVSDTDGRVVDLHQISSALDCVAGEGDARLLHQAGAEQHAITRNADDVALEPREISEEDLDCLLLAVRPSLRHPKVPVLDFLSGAGSEVIRRRRWLTQVRTR